jgi:hypothetical protein
MSDLRDAAELALTALENTCPNNWTSVKENLRKALAQPKREWVGLTDEEIWEVINRTAWVGTEEEIRFKIAEAILRKAQEK